MKIDEVNNLKSKVSKVGESKMKEIYQKDIQELYQELNTSSDGLKGTVAKSLQTKYGKNVLKENEKTTKMQIFLKQFQNVMIILLLVVGVLSLVYAIINKQDFLEPIVILGTSLLNCFMGFLQEAKAEDAIGKLKKYAANYVTVKRNGKYEKINAVNLVVGDYIVLEAGDKIPADCRVVESYFAKVDESILTGESMTVDKDEQVISGSVPLSERSNMIYSGTVLVFGKLEAIVTAIGMETELGKIASVIDNASVPLTPLQVKVEKVSKFITLVASFLVGIVLFYGIIKGYDVLSIVMLCISMIVASVPESLPVAITATLSIGVNQMAKKKSVVRNLAAIETLGATEVICSDKTGTLTENKLEVVSIYDYEKEIDVNSNEKVCEIMDLCNGAILNEHNEYIGDAVDVAIKESLGSKKVTGGEKIIELPFDSDRKLMSVVYAIDDKVTIYTKGSLESVLASSSKYMKNGKTYKLTDKIKEQFINQEKVMSDEALKVIALAYKDVKSKISDEDDFLDEEKDLVIVGLIGLRDPIRENIKEAIQSCLNANVRPIMLTGDNLLTASSIAKCVGICKSDDECINATELDNFSDDELLECALKYSVFARVTPEHKLRIVTSLQNSGKVVAMTGDGVNDAPAIKLANVGIGMGISGTNVTKDVSDIILLDDSFNTISLAIAEGRRIYDNVITNILYNLSSNFTEILIILFGMFTGTSIISAIHVLYIDLVADTIPSIMLAFEGAASDVMQRKPNGLNKRIFTKFFSAFLIASVFLETMTSLYVYFHFKGLGVNVAQTLALLSIIFNEFVFAYNCRSLKEQIHKRGVFSNKYLNIGIFFLIVVQLIVFLSPVGKTFGLVTITFSQFIFVVLVNIISYLIIEFLKPFIVLNFEDV